MAHDEKVEFIRHVPCPDCRSQDNGSLYSDGHVFCHVCRYYAPGDGTAARTTKRKMPSSLIALESLEIKAIEPRKLSEETCRKWGYGFGDHPKMGRVQVATYYDKKGNPVGQKLRNKDKDFRFLGDSDEATLYGQHLWRDSGKMVVVTEGEIDALSVSQAQGNKWPVVSIPNGAQGAAKAIARNLEWLEGFEKVVLMFDMDEHGHKAAREVAELLTPGKAFIARLPLKDPNEMLVAGRIEELTSAIWGAKVFRPDEIVGPVDLWTRLVNRPKLPAISYPWLGLEKLTLGCRSGEIVCIGAGTGTGKSQITAEIVHHFSTAHKQKCGIIALEESVEKTALKLVGLELNRRVLLDDSGLDQGALRAAYDKVFGEDRIYLYDHFGSLASDNLLKRIRYMVRGLGCETVILDHVSIVVSGNDGDEDERRTLDKLMTDLRSLVEQLKFRLIIVSHLTRPSGDKGHEQGIEVVLKHFRGSHAIPQLSDLVIALERNQQNPKLNKYTRVRLLKSRFVGEVGVACWLQWNPETGRMVECNEPSDSDEDSGVDKPEF